MSEDGGLRYRRYMELETATSTPQPFLKWAGGKRGLLHEILPRVPKFEGRYIEAFLGAGAVFFAQDHDIPKLVNDFNSDLIEVYEVIRDNPHDLIEELKLHKNTKTHYFEVRGWDRRADYLVKRTKVERAARFIFLNKTCFNGLYRVNSKGHFNVPYGYPAKPNWIAEDNLLAVSRFLNAETSSGRLVTLMSGDYGLATAAATPSDFVYLDPPYAPISETSSFVSYQSTGFTSEDQEKLRNEVIRLTQLGVPVLLSNSDTKLIHDLYGTEKSLNVSKVSVSRAISAKSASRGKIGEVLVDNFEAVGARLV